MQEESKETASKSIRECDTDDVKSVLNKTDSKEAVTPYFDYQESLGMIMDCYVSKEGVIVYKLTPTHEF